MFDDRQNKDNLFFVKTILNHTILMLVMTVFTNSFWYWDSVQPQTSFILEILSSTGAVLACPDGIQYSLCDIPFLLSRRVKQHLYDTCDLLTCFILKSFLFPNWLFLFWEFSFQCNRLKTKQKKTCSNKEINRSPWIDRFYTQLTLLALTINLLHKYRFDCLSMSFQTNNRMTIKLNLKRHLPIWGAFSSVKSKKIENSRLIDRLDD